MRLNPRSRFALVITVLLMLTAFLTACKGPNPAAIPTAEATALPPTVTPAAPEIILVDAQGAAPAALTTVITDFAAANSMQVRTMTALAASDFSAGTKIVIFTSDPGNLAEMSTAAASVQFVVLGNSNVTAGGNISTIKANPADRAFMAGYLTMLLARDWRAAGLLTSDSALGDSYADAFINGAEYVCGKCLNYFAPLVQFPVVISEPTGSAEATWANDAATLGQNWLGAVFIDPAAAYVSVANGLSAYPINYESVTFVGYAEVPSDAGLIWDVLLDTDTVSSLSNMLPLLLAGQGGNEVHAQVVMTQINEAVVTPAKQEFFNATAAKLASGELDPLSIP
jgi:hypothetical protein